MTIELWLIPAGVTIWATVRGIRISTEICEFIGTDRFGKVLRGLVWILNFAIATALSALAWLIWLAFT